MGNPNPFEVGRQIGNNFSKSFNKVNDDNAIENILAEANSSGDPKVLQNTIGQILSKVSPERQPMALQYLQKSYQNVTNRQKEERIQKTEQDKLAREQMAAKQAGYTHGVPPQVAAQQIKDKAKSERLQQFGLGGSGNDPLNLPNAENGTTPYLSGAPGREENANPVTPKSKGSVFSRLSDDQLVVASGASDREVSEPAKAELKRRDEDKKITQRRDSDVFKSDLGRSAKVLERADTIAEQIPQKRTAINLMKDAVANRNLGFFSPDNLAEITGIEGLRSPEGAIFKTAGKEYFLGNIARAGARPNQWIEQQIADMMAKIGRSPEANFSVLRALENELDLDQERVKLTNDISDRLRTEGNYSQGKLGSLVNKDLSKYAEQKQDILFNDLRAIKAISEKTPQKFRKVESGTRVSEFMAQALLNQFGNDPKKAADEAKKLGYEF